MATTTPTTTGGADRARPATAGRPRGARPRARSRRRWGTTALAVAIVAVLLFPLYWMVNASLQPSAALLSIPPRWFPEDPTLDGYRAAVDTQGRHLLISLFVACGNVVLTLAVAAPLAWALARFRLRVGPVLLFALLIVQMVPGIVMANSLFALFNTVGLLNNTIGLMLAHSTLSVPFAAILLRAFMQDLPREITEAAAIDGAGQWRTFRSVVLPMSRNAVITAGLFAFLFSWADFLFAITMTTRDAITPVTVGIYRFIGANTTDWNAVMASAVLASIPAAVLLVLAQRYIAAGITGGAVKD
ncbi:carbohydrate ABC transporter permease [Allostreptomyces psammosilenae]|uniref:Multiple sugar transport system permease protein n=1 Tax=Allostreptomyces psammosilenae TaxID=1892865 RepID=A0A852ZZV3_9ACTN|nr:carbohydrate ABC transporter permease [Allostreptomyces psammosilenae]NYI07679.1 multiple sugar transport system permease protein [Allostreptomyces psammosilenae]